MFLIHLSIMLPGITLKGDGTLIIERVKKDDEGIYECRASNAGGEAKTSAVITVVGEFLDDDQLFAYPYFFIHHSYYKGINCAVDCKLCTVIIQGCVSHTTT